MDFQEVWLFHAISMLFPCIRHDAYLWINEHTFRLPLVSAFVIHDMACLAQVEKPFRGGWVGTGRPSCFQSCAGPIDRWCSAVLAGRLMILTSNYIYIYGISGLWGADSWELYQDWIWLFHNKVYWEFVPSGELSVEFWLTEWRTKWRTKWQTTRWFGIETQGVFVCSVHDAVAQLAQKQPSRL